MGSNSKLLVCLSPAGHLLWFQSPAETVQPKRTPKRSTLCFSEAWQLTSGIGRLLQAGRTRCSPWTRQPR